MSDVPDDLRQLGPYELNDKLGEGAAGVVYRAEHEILEREYAVKIVHRRLASNETFRKRFYREARLAARLDHPNIVGVVTADTDGDHYYLVMEYVEGRSLDELVGDGPLPVVRAVECVEHVLAGLEYAHDQGMLHRDVKAENILVGADGEPKLTDFGLVVDVNEGSDLTDLEEARSDARRWRRETRDLLQGLSEAIERQFDRWDLTPAEREVALLLLKGFSHREVAELREVSERTVRQQAHVVYDKADLAGRAELSAFFLEDLLVPIEEGPNEE